MEGITTSGKEMTHYDLRRAMTRRESLVKTGRWQRTGEQIEPDYLPMEWNDGRKGREGKILAALYGTDVGGKPGLEVLKEERARLIKNIEEEREQVSTTIPYKSPV